MQIPIGILDANKHDELSIPSEIHSAVFGKSGVGKSVYLGNLAEALIQAEEGFTFIDPHGSVVERLLARIPGHRMSHTRHDVVLLSVKANEVPGINIFASKGEIDDIVSAILDTFAKTFEGMWYESSDSVMRWACYAVMEQPYTPTFLTVKKFLKDDSFLKACLKHVKNPNVLEEFSGYEKREWKQVRAERIAPVLNKLDKFITNKHIRSIVGQDRALDFRKIMDEGRIFLVDLSGLGKKEKAMLGGLILNMLFIAAQTRKPGKGKRHTIIVDEAQTFVSAPYDFILAELRKYNVTLHIGTQFIAGFPEYVRSSIFGNVGTSVVFRVGAEDAEILAKEMTMDQRPEVIQRLPNKQAYIVTLKYDPQMNTLLPTGPHKLTVFPPSQATGEEMPKGKVRTLSLKWFAKSKEQVLRLLDNIAV